MIQDIDIVEASLINNQPERFEISKNNLGSPDEAQIEVDFVCQEDCLISARELIPFVTQGISNWDEETTIAQVSIIPDNSLQIEVSTNSVASSDEPQIEVDFACQEDCLISARELIPFVTQGISNWDQDITIAQVSIPQNSSLQIEMSTNSVASPDEAQIEVDFACQEDCLISQRELTPSVTQGMGNGNNVKVTEVEIAEDSLRKLEIAKNNFSFIVDQKTNNSLVCEDGCLISEEEFAPFITHFITQGIIKPIDRILVPKIPIPTIEEEEKPDPTIEEPAKEEPEDFKVTPALTDQLVENAISATAERYPWIVNGSDKLTFSTNAFQPRTQETYLNLDLRISEDNPFLNKLGMGNFPYDEQLYWVLEDNIVVGNIAGGLSGIVYQGKETNQTLVQTFTSIQSFTGYQAVWVIPNDLQRLFKIEDLDDYQIISLGGELINPEGSVAQGVEFNTDNIIRDDREVIILPNPRTVVNNSQIGVASTFNPRGGGSLFANVELENAPLVLQGFPTANLQALASVDIKEGAVIPDEVLREAGIFWNNLLTGEQAPPFNPDITSIPGIKIAQRDTFDNLDLLNILVNPYLTERERYFSYWNSLMWIGLGIQPPQVQTIELENERKEFDWYRIYFSGMNNRFLIQYSKDEVEATFYNVFSNPGFSLTLSFEEDELDDVQSINSTIGMMIGGIFDFVDLELLDTSIKEAKKQKGKNELFKPLQTKATSDQRRSINTRLNRTLNYVNLGSSLDQVSGFVTFPSVITPEDSSVFQIRTGNIRRAVQFIQSDVEAFEEGETVVRTARLSNEDFGPLTFLGSSLPIQPTQFEQGGQPINEASSAQVILVSPEGKQFIQQFNSRDLTAVPIGIRTFDLVFDRLSLEKTDSRRVTNKFFNGYINLPTLELAYAGTSDDWNYTFNSGVWFNVNNQSVGTIRKNEFGTYEPTVGVYVNSLVSKIMTDYTFDENNLLSAVNSHVPFLRFSWNSANNSNNPWQATLAYQFARETRKYGLSLTSSLGIIPQYSNAVDSFVGFFNGRFGLPMGASLKGNLELGEQIFYGVELSQQVVPEFRIGAYLRNSTEINLGFNSRNVILNYGGTLEYQLPKSPSSLKMELGAGEDGKFIWSLKGDVRF